MMLFVSARMGDHGPSQTGCVRSKGRPLLCTRHSARYTSRIHTPASDQGPVLGAGDSKRFGFQAPPRLHVQTCDIGVVGEVLRVRMFVWRLGQALSKPERGRQKLCGVGRGAVWWRRHARLPIPSTAQNQPGKLVIVQPGLCRRKTCTFQGPRTAGYIHKTGAVLRAGGQYRYPRRELVGMVTDQERARRQARIATEDGGRIEKRRCEPSALSRVEGP